MDFIEAAFTLPVIFPFCACVMKQKRMAILKRGDNFFIRSVWLLLYDVKMWCTEHFDDRIMTNFVVYVTKGNYHLPAAPAFNNCLINPSCERALCQKRNTDPSIFFLVLPG